MITKDQLYRFFQGLTNLHEEIQIREWIESNPANRKEYEEERKLHDMIMLLNDEDSLAMAPVIPFYQRKWFRTAMQGAAMIVAMVGGAWGYQKYMTNQPQELNYQTLSIPAGQQLDVCLPDGTNISLNSNSKITYPTFFSKNERRVKLQGEAYFDVAHNADKPFIVETEKGQIEVLGTKFYVESYSDENFFETSLIEGSVKFKQGKYAYLLKPNQKITFKDGHLNISRITDYNAYRWREGLICFQDETFGSILRQFERSFGVKTEVENKKLLEYRYTGKFRHSDGILYALSVLQHDVNFQFARNEDTHVICIK